MTHHDDGTGPARGPERRPPPPVAAEELVGRWNYSGRGKGETGKRPSVEFVKGGGGHWRAGHRWFGKGRWTHFLWTPRAGVLLIGEMPVMVRAGRPDIKEYRVRVTRVPGGFRLEGGPFNGDLKRP